VSTDFGNFERFNSPDILTSLTRGISRCVAEFDVGAICHASVTLSPSCHWARPGSFPGQFMLNSWWTKWQWGG
jgi:hypothetical protein